MNLSKCTPQKDNRSTIPSLGDTDQGPDSTDLWFSFEEENEENNPKVQTLAYLDEEDHHHKTHTLDFLDDGTSILPDYLKEYARSLPELADKDFAVEVKFLKKMKLEEKIKRVQKGIFVQDCLGHVRQDFSKGAQIYDKHKLVKMLNRNYNKNKDGTIEMINKDLIKKQNQIQFYLFKQFGSSLFSGKPVMSLSLPITIFEPRSELERQAQQLVYAPYFLEKGGSTRNTFEQFKLSVTHFIASLHTSISPYKSFSANLGETFQGIIGGCPVYFEQISQNPHVSAFQMLGKNFAAESCLEISPSLLINSVKYKRLGFSKIIYKNNRTEVQAQYPSLVMNGLAYGKKSIQFEGKFYLVDLENQYYAEINFDVCKSNSFIDERNKFGKDYFSGSIWKITESFADRMRKNMKGIRDIGIRFIQKEHAIFRIENIEGLWLEYIKIGDNTYWTFGNPWPYQLQHVDNALPSDSDNRLDILYLKQNDEIKAQENKKILEEIQRNDKRLREQVRRSRLK